MCVSMKMLPGGARIPVVFMCVGADRSTLILVKEWKMLGVPPRRLSRHLSLPDAHPLNVANEAAVTRSERGRNPTATGL